jgi:hypothetical protein
LGLASDMTTAFLIKCRRSGLPGGRRQRVIRYRDSTMGAREAWVNVLY